MNVALHRHRRWGTALGAVLALVLVAAQWFSLAHTHAADGLAPECTVCEQAPAFEHAAAPFVAPASAVLHAPRPVTFSVLPEARVAPTARARGPPRFFVPIA